MTLRLQSILSSMPFIPDVLPISPEAAHIHQYWREIIAAFQGKRLLVVGDIIADEYLIGAATRLSREAPIPIINQQEHFTVPGGATNSAVNAATLGAEVYIAGIIGDDESGVRLREKLSEYTIHQDMLITEADRPTSTKLRILANNNQGIIQHVARIDNIDTSPAKESTIHTLLTQIADIIPTVDCVILSDYDNGLMGTPLVDRTIALTRRHDRIVIADAHGALERFQRVTAITPNQPEAEEATGIRIHNNATLDQAGSKLLRITSAQYVLITRGSEGMTLFERGRSPLHLPAHSVDARDTTGAGDTVASTFTLALASGASPYQAATLSNLAGAMVVQQLGCATNTPENLLRATLAFEM